MFQFEWSKSNIINAGLFLIEILMVFRDEESQEQQNRDFERKRSKGKVV
jgi:hypothetical protein